MQINTELNKQQQHLIGTLFEEEELQKKTNVYNLKAKDDQGKKRFQGAFTGAYKEFDAGYKGTCGSEEGFVPKAFQSNRNKRVSRIDQVITDYMDEEDLGKNIIGQNLKSNSQYDQQKFGSEEQNDSQQTNQMGHNLLGKYTHDLVVVNKNSIGHEIIQNLKRKKNQQLYESIIQQTNAGKEFFENLEELQQEDYNQFLKPKARNYINLPQYQGLCSDKTQNFNFDPIEQSLSECFNSILRKKQRLNDDNNPQQQAQNNIQNRIYTNPMGLDNEFEDEYNTEIITEEDQELQDQKKQITTIISQQTLSQMIVKLDQPETIQNIQIKAVPKDYDHLKKIKDFMAQGGQQDQYNNQPKNQASKHTIESRQDLIEDNTNLKHLQSQIKTKKFVKGKGQEMGGDDLEDLFHMDKDKAERYKYFCLEKSGRIVGGTHFNLKMDQIMKEREEFEIIYMKMEQKNKEKAEVMKKIENLEEKLNLLKNFRKREKWFPAKLVCSRFNCPPPYKDQEYYYFKKLEEKNQQEFEKQKEIKLQEPLTDENFKTDQQESEQKKPEEDQENLELKMYGLPTQFKGKKQAKFKSSGFQMSDNTEAVQNQDSLADNKQNQGLQEQFIDKTDDDHSNKANQINEQEQQPVKKEIPIDLFQSIFDDDD